MKEQKKRQLPSWRELEWKNKAKEAKPEVGRRHIRLPRVEQPIRLEETLKAERELAERRLMAARHKEKSTRPSMAKQRKDNEAAGAPFRLVLLTMIVAIALFASFSALSPTGLAAGGEPVEQPAIEPAAPLSAEPQQELQAQPSQEEPRPAQSAILEIAPGKAVAIVLKDAGGNVSKAGVEAIEKDIRLKPSEGPVNQIDLRGVQIAGGSIELGYDDVPESAVPAVNSEPVVEIYAIDPSTLNFSTGTITVAAKGDALYKCASWDFSSRTCPQGWAFLQDIVPGTDYTVAINATDPAFSETKQNNATAGKDTFLDANTADTNKDLIITIDAGRSPGGGDRRKRALVEFDVSNIPSNAVITAANLQLFAFSASGDIIEVHRTTSGWVENQATWNKNTSNVNWTTAGGDYAQFNVTFTATANQWSIINVSDIVRGWVNGSFPNYGFLIRHQDESNNALDQFNSSDVNGTGPPKLELNYTVPIAITFVSPTPNNGSTVNLSHAFVNVTLSYNATSAVLQWNGTNQTMAAGASNATWFRNMTGLANGNYSYKVWANDSSGSYASGTMTVNIEAPPDVTPPVISGVNATSITTSSATIVWTTDESANSTVNYGTSAALGTRVSDATPVTSHSIDLTGLNSSTLYHYNVSSCDALGNCATSGPRNFTTSASDQPPTFSGLVDNSTSATPGKNTTVQINITLSDDVALSSYTFSWNDTGSFVNDTAVSISGTSLLVSLNKTVTANKSSVIGYRFYFNDSLNQQNTTSTGSFAVRNSPPSVPSQDLPANSTATIDSTPFFNWTASIDADSDSITYRIQLDNDTDFSSPAADNLTSASNFTPGTLADAIYYWRVRAETGDANSSYSSARTITVDTAAPSVSFVSPTPANSSFTQSAVTINVSHTESNPDKIVLTIDGAVNATQSYSGTNTIFQRNLSDGSHTFSVAANDTAGNSASTGTRNITADAALPQISQLGEPADPSTFSATANYRFNATVTDNVNVSNVVLEFDGVNYSHAAGQLTKSGSVYNRTFPALAAATYSYKWHANDTSGNTNLTASQSFTIDKAVTALSLDFSPGSTVTFNTTTSVTCTANNPESVPTLTRNSTAVGNPDSGILPAGTWSYSCTANATQNYTSDSESGSLVVNKATSSLTIALVPSSSVTFGTTVNATCTANNTEISLQFFRNATAISSPSSASLAGGIYNFTCTNNATQNYTAATAQANLTVNRALTSTTLLLNGSALNQQVVYNTTTNATASTDVLSVSLYRNGTQVSNPEIGVIAGGVWNYTALNAGNQNYSASDSTLFLTVTRLATTTSLTLNGNASNLSVVFGTATNASASTSALSVSLTRNSASVSNPDAGTLAAGEYNYSATNAGNQNYSGSSASFTLTIQKASNSVNITINSNFNQNVTVTLGNASNVTAAAAVGTLTLYRNGANVSSPDAAILSAGKYNYTAIAEGSENYTSNSTTYFLFVKPNITATKFNGNSTNLSSVQDTTAMANFVLEIAGSGKIQWALANISNHTSLDDAVNISSNLVSVDSAAVPGLNSSATISLYAITFTDPAPQYDPDGDGTFADCPGTICTEISYSGGTYVFNVTRFTSYRSIEGFVEPPPASSSGGGGGGGGGGGSGTGGGGCPDTWACTQWSECSNGTRTRSCTNSNFLCTNVTKPATAEPCSKACVENWVCSEWSACYGEGIQTRFCTDRSKCGTGQLKPEEARDCTLPEATCYDSIQNQDEEGVDCGGSCEPCGAGLPTAGELVIPSQRAPNPLLATLTIVLLLALIAVASLSRTDLSKRLKLVLTGMHVLLISSLAILLAITLTNERIIGNILDPTRPDIYLVAALAGGIVLLAALFLFAGRLKKAVARYVPLPAAARHESHSRPAEISYTEIRAKRRHHPKEPGLLSKAGYKIEGLMAGAGESIKEMLMQEPPEKDVHPLHVRMTGFEHDLERKLSFLHESMKTFSSAVHSLHNEVTHLHRQNRKFMRRIAAGQQPKERFASKLQKKAQRAEAKAGALSTGAIGKMRQQMEKVKASKPVLSAKLPKLSLGMPKMALPRLPARAILKKAKEQKVESPDLEAMRKAQSSLTENERAILEIIGKKFAPGPEQRKLKIKPADLLPEKTAKAPAITKKEMDAIGRELLSKLRQAQKPSARAAAKPALTAKEAKYVDHLRSRYGLAPLKSGGALKTRKQGERK